MVAHRANRRLPGRRTRIGIGSLVALCLLGSACGTDEVACTPAPTPRVGPWWISDARGHWSLRFEAAATAPERVCVVVEADGERRRLVAESRLREAAQVPLEVAPADAPGAYRLYELPVGIPRGRYTVGTAVVAAPDAPTDVVRLVVIGDSNGAHVVDGQRVLATFATAAAARRPHLWVHTGDMVYHVSVPIGSWTGFWRDTAPLHRVAPWLPAVGNHEYEFPKEYPSYTGPWLATGDEPGVDRVHVADVGPLRLVAVDSNDDELSPSAWEAMWATAEAALRVDRPWKGIVLHHPTYTTSEHAPRTDLRERLSALDAAVDLQFVLHGHNHVFEWWSTDRFEVFVTGGGGALLYALDQHRDANPDAVSRMGIAAYHWLELNLGVTEATFVVHGLTGELGRGRFAPH